MTDSMIWNAMTTSMQLAEECLKERPSSGEEQAEATQPFEGLESFAQTIESGELLGFPHFCRLSLFLESQFCFL